MALPLVRFTDMKNHDDTRPSEWFSGLAMLLMGYWLWHFYTPPNTATGHVMFDFVGPGLVAVGFMLVGGLQLATAGQTRALWFRRMLNLLAGAACVYTLVAYWMTDRDSLVTPVLMVFILKMAWVKWRIDRDRTYAG